MSDRKMVGTVGFAMVENPCMPIFRAIGPTSKEKIDRVLIQHTVAGRVRQTKSVSDESGAKQTRIPPFPLANLLVGLTIFCAQW